MKKLSWRRRRHRKARVFRSVVPGAAPGTVRAPEGAAETRLRVTRYDGDDLEEIERASLDDVAQAIGRRGVVWIEVDGLSDADVLVRIGELVGLHRLALEDVVNLGQRPKADIYAQGLFVSGRIPPASPGDDYEQLSLLLAEGICVSFRERRSDIFEPVRVRLRDARTRFRSSGADYLVYALLDTVIDSYFPLLERFADRIVALEEEALREPTDETLLAIRQLRVQLLDLRRLMVPLREAVGLLVRHETPLIGDATRVYLRDCFDHAAQVVDLLETYRELSTDLMNVYLSSVSNRMNAVMKVLTIIATIFIPLGFIAGLYGMNFDTSSPYNMPELSLAYGYPLALGVMLLVVVGFLVYFRRKGWL